jgi:transcriptional regulator with XRE-family HTH domain
MALVAGPQLRAARAMARLGQDRLAELAGITTATVQRLEAQPGRLRTTTRTLDALQAALEAVGVLFVNHDRPGVLMRELPETVPADASESAPS